MPAAGSEPAAKVTEPLVPAAYCQVSADCEPGVTPTGYRPIQLVVVFCAAVVVYETVSAEPAATVPPSAGVSVLAGGGGGVLPEPAPVKASLSGVAYSSLPVIGGRPSASSMVRPVL